MESKSVFRDRKQLDVAGAPHQVRSITMDPRNKDRRFTDKIRIGAVFRLAKPMSVLGRRAEGALEFLSV